jgi:hypothetical protein
MDYTVTATARDEVIVEGASDSEVRIAMALFGQFKELQAETVEVRRQDLLRAVAWVGLDLVPPAALEQARKIAALRGRLLLTPAYSYETLAEVRGDASIASTRTWVSRRRDARQMFTVVDSQRTVIPGFQFSAEGELRSELAPMLDVLMGAGIDGWSLWAWLSTPSSLLSGEVPEQVAFTDQRRALRAARRFVAR